MTSTATPRIMGISTSAARERVFAIPEAVNAAPKRSATMNTAFVPLGYTVASNLSAAERATNPA